MFEGLSDGELLDAMGEAQRAQRVATARGLLAVGRFTQGRLAVFGDSHEDWCVDDWEMIAVEVAAELGISRGRASRQMADGRTLLEELPKLAAVFSAGDVDVRIISVILFRTGLITDTAAMARIDAQVAERAPNWNRLSDKKVRALVDWMVIEVDPNAIRVARQHDDDRHLDIRPDQYGMAEIWGKLRASTAAALDQKLDALAATVCPSDPRTARQRRTDALDALTAKADAIACTCGSDGCSADGEAAASGMVIHLVAETATVEGRRDTPGYLSGYGPIPAATITELAKRATLRPIVNPKQLAEPQYRPSTALAEFIRCRDLTCAWMGCDKPAWDADIDHTIPYPSGPTHPSNTKCYCRTHHLTKTFCGWTDSQLPDGTLIVTSPIGRSYPTKPLGALLFPQLRAPTGELIVPTTTAPPHPLRALSMPRRKRTRDQDRANRIQHERKLNAARYAANPPPF